MKKSLLTMTENNFEELPENSSVAYKIKGFNKLSIDEQQRVRQEAMDTDLVKLLIKRKNRVVFTPEEVSIGVLAPDDDAVINVNFKLTNMPNEHKMKFIEACHKQVKALFPNNSILLTQEDDVATVEVNIKGDDNEI